MIRSKTYDKNTFLLHVKKLVDGPITNGEACWIWQRSKDYDGYGVCTLYKSASSRKIVTRKAHRAAYILFIGPISIGLFVCHNCDIPDCVNPKHLWLGTVIDNNRDAKVKGRLALGFKNGAYTHPEKKRKGETHGRSKITIKDVKYIRKHYVPGYGGRNGKGSCNKDELAKLFSIDPMQVYCIATRRSWKHI